MCYLPTAAARKRGECRDTAHPASGLYPLDSVLLYPFDSPYFVDYRGAVMSIPDWVKKNFSNLAVLPCTGRRVYLKHDLRKSFFWMSRLELVPVPVSDVDRAKERF